MVAKKKLNKRMTKIKVVTIKVVKKKTECRYLKIKVDKEKKLKIDT